MTNTASKAERAALAGSTTATTLFQQATAHIELEDSGRFGALARERAAQPTVAGSEPFVRYPGGASWTSDPNMLEPPLGYSVDAMEPVGEIHEQKATSSGSSSGGGVAEGGSDVASGWPGRVSPKSALPPTTAAAHERLGEILPKMIRRRPLR